MQVFGQQTRDFAPKLGDKRKLLRTCKRHAHAFQRHPFEQAALSLVTHYTSVTYLGLLASSMLQRYAILPLLARKAADIVFQLTDSSIRDAVHLRDLRNGIIICYSDRARTHISSKYLDGSSRSARCCDEGTS